MVALDGDGGRRAAYGRWPCWPAWWWPAAACSTAPTIPAPLPTAPMRPLGRATSASPPASSGAVGAGPCPENLVIQTDWFPEIEHGGIYQLIGGGGTIDKERMRYSGPLRPAYQADLGVSTVEIRAGGAAIDDRQVVDEMVADDAIYFGFVNTDDAIAARAQGISVVGVAATLDLSPQMLMWSPTRHDITRFEDLGDSGAPVLHFPGLNYVDFLVSRGFVEEDQLDPSYDGSPARWLESEGEVIQQGFATNEVYTYENDLEGWRKRVDFFLIHWFGYENYPAMLTIRADRLAAERPCLERLVPVLQQAWVDFLTGPDEVSATVVDVVAAYDTFWQLSTGLNADAVGKMRQYEIASNGSDDTYGNFDESRADRFFGIVAQIFAQRGTPLPAGLSARDIVTNEFIDPAVSLPDG